MTRLLHALSLTRLLLVFALVAVFVMSVVMAARTSADTDAYWHLRAGEWQIEHRAFLQIDQFSNSRAGDPWLNHSWLSQILMFGLTSALGVAVGFAVWTAVLATVGMAFVARQCEGDPLVRAFCVVLAAAAAAVFWSPRPQMASFFLSAVVLYLLQRYQCRGEDRLWIIPPVMLVWANLHGGYAIGFMLIVLALLGDAVRWLIDGVMITRSEDSSAARPTLRPVTRLAEVGLASVIAVCVNPLGPRVLLVPFQTVGIKTLRDFIQEWASPNFHQSQTWPFLWLLLLTFVAAGASRKRLDWREAILVSGFAYLSLLSARNIPTFALAAAPVLALHLNALLAERNIAFGWDRLPRTGAYGALNLLLLLVVLGGAAFQVTRVLAPQVIAEARRQALPMDAVEFIEETQPPQKMFNSYNWGGYLIWALRDYPVYVDGRTDLYTDTVLNDYLTIYFAQDGWDRALENAGINTVLVEGGSPLARVLADNPAWEAAYSDHLARVFVREVDSEP